MKNNNAEIVARYRKRHPDRARIQAQQNYARAAAARRLAERHLSEFEELMEAECKKRGIPRWLPPMHAEEDARTVEYRAKVKQ